MKKIINQLLRMGLITVTGILGSITSGLMIHGSDVFDYQGIYFAFVAFGLSGAFIFSFYHVFGLSNAITVAVSVSAFQFIAAATTMPLLNAAFWSFGVNVPVVGLAFLFERKLSVLHEWKFIVVGAVYGSVFVLLTLIIGIFRDISPIPPSVFQDNFIDGLLIGIGMGLGVQAGEAFVHSLFPETK
jgi:hypothetical protein